ncbi:hypothetical protein C8A00DRAFT_38531 [Chaetomidium leptoderma]|uniref:Uncharacterized protein n=1 Tax=Chaetomidium leptoderma TaxID=669021 RepID=A0AAN6ZTZ2_9PEZI|nr:hypothetical protein C8A00DRAFT_38531 [Chaetomidium leptoderma]
MRLPIAALAIALLSPQLGALASPSPKPATLEDLTALAIRLGNGEPVPKNVHITDRAPPPKLAVRQNYCGIANSKGSCCCNYCYGWMCSLSCGVSPLCH